ncbi:hypothetical protein L3Q82_020981, partial [Scortum barcoo]
SVSLANMDPADQDSGSVTFRQTVTQQALRYSISLTESTWSGTRSATEYPHRSSRALLSEEHPSGENPTYSGGAQPKNPNWVCVWKGGQSRERVQHPDSLVDEAVPQSAGPGPQALQSPS